MQSSSEMDHNLARQSMVELIELYVQLSSERIDKHRLDARVMAAMSYL